MTIAIMAAKARNNVIGKNNDLVWHLPADLKHFKKTTHGHYVIMGRKTFESLGRPLPGRLNIIITRNRDLFIEGAIVLANMQEALDLAESQHQQLVFILGGGEIYRQTMDQADVMFITEIHHEFEGDTHFPDISDRIWDEAERFDFPADDENPYPYSFVKYIRRDP
jgi:dihydrofolate reductase